MSKNTQPPVPSADLPPPSLRDGAVAAVAIAGFGFDWQAKLAEGRYDLDDLQDLFRFAMAGGARGDAGMATSLGWIAALAAWWKASPRLVHGKWSLAASTPEERILTARALLRAAFWAATAKGQLHVRGEEAAMLVRREAQQTDADPSLALQYLATFDAGFTGESLLRDVACTLERFTTAGR